MQVEMRGDFTDFETRLGTSDKKTLGICVSHAIRSYATCEFQKPFDIILFVNN